MTLHLFSHLTEEQFALNSDGATYSKWNPRTGRAVVITKKKLPNKSVKQLPDAMREYVERDWLARSILDDYHQKFLDAMDTITDREQTEAMEYWHGMLAGRRETEARHKAAVREAVKMVAKVKRDSDLAVRDLNAAAVRVLELHGRQEPIRFKGAFWDIGYRRATGTVFLTRRGKQPSEVDADSEPTKKKTAKKSPKKKARRREK